MERRTKPEVRECEQGYLLVAMVLMVSLVLIALAVAAPVVARDLRRDKEVESMHRQQEYVRALRLYYRKFKTYPPSMDALEKSNNVRYLRKQYIDPLTGKADWRIIHVGENQTTVKGFFGEPLGGLNSTGAGLGSAASMAPSIGNTPTTGTSVNTGCTGLNSAFCNQASTTSTSGNSLPGFGSSSSSSGFGSGGVGQIMGVGTAKSGDSILTPNQQATYDTWEFLYDPRIELMYAKSNILGGGGLGSQSASSMGGDATNGIPGQTTPNSPNSGNSSGGTGSGGPAFGGTGGPMSPTSPTTPRQ